MVRLGESVAAPSLPLCLPMPAPALPTPGHASRSPAHLVSPPSPGLYQPLSAGDVNVHELLGMLGVFGCVWSAAQGLPLELGTLTAAAWGPSALLPFLGFGACMFVFYSLVPYELKWGGAALLNISLLASDLWAAAARFLFFGGLAGGDL